MKHDAPVDATHLRNQIMSVVRRLRSETQSGSIPLAQLTVLGAIDRLADQATPSALAAAERVRSSNLASLLRSMEESDLIRRVADTEDRRKIRVSLTRHGRAVLHQDRVRRDQWLAATIQACLTRAEQQLLAEAGALLDRIARA
ncbi:MarR family winged helix-turn-helix transcriptional regulator [Dyella choica]|uniref:MarR family transcriptional regulator n=1 Tax=Dyella choica TaxID=1927959 RepID=A0A3S0S303_9GAMM|nr:MarR family transcriptional regulator [Dyella choica]RUL79794.1 MarR family transcriptional regulator [Dyella choica]